LVAIPHAGKAACLNRTFEKADGDVLFITDVRQLLDPQALSWLVANFADPGVGAATCEMRLLPGSSGEHRDTDLYWRYELWTRKRHSEIDSLFTATGCIYALRRELAVALPPDTLSDDAYLSLIAFSRGYRVIFDPQAIAFDYPAVAEPNSGGGGETWQGVGRSICACRGYSPRPIACGSIFCLTSSRGLCCRGRCWQFWRSPRRCPTFTGEASC